MIAFQDLTLTEPAKLSESKFTYQANAIDKNGQEYKMVWIALNTDSDDDREWCDWQNPIEIIKL